MSTLDLKLRFKAMGDMAKPFKTLSQSTQKLTQEFDKNKDKASKMQRQLKAIGNYKRLQTQMTENGSALAKMRDTARRLEQQLKATKNPSAKLRAEFKKARNSVTKLEEKHRSYLVRLKSVRDKLVQTGGSTRKLTKQEAQLKDKLAQTNSVLDKQAKKLDALRNKENKLAQARAKYKSKQQSLTNASMMGLGAGTAGASGLYGLKRMLGPAVGFHEQMSAVGAISRVDKNSKQYKALEQTARDLGKTTQFSALEAAQGMQFLAMAGFNANQQIAAMPAMLDLAKVGNMELGDTADIASNILSAFKLEAKDMTRVADVMAATITSTNVDVRMLGDTMKYVAPVAQKAGVSLEQASAMAGLLGNIGIQGEAAGSAMRNIYNRLAKPPSEAHKMLTKLGISTKDANGNLRDMTDIFSDIAKATKNLGSAEQLAAFADIGGLRAGAGLSELVDMANKGEITKLAEALKEKGFSHNVARDMGDNLAGDIKEMTSAWGEFNLVLADGTNSPFRAFVKWITKGIRGITDFAKEHPKLTKYVVMGAAALSAFLAVAGMLMAGLLPLVSAILMFRFGITSMLIKATGIPTVLGAVTTSLKFVGMAFVNVGNGLLANPLFLAIALLASAAYLIYQNWAGISGFFSTLWADIKGAFTGGFEGIKNLIVEWNPLTMLTRSLHIALEALGFEVPMWFGELGKNMTSSLVDGIASGYNKIKNKVVGLGSSITGWFKEVLGINSPSTVFATFGQDIIAGLVNGIKAKIQWAKEAIGNVSDAVIGRFKSLLGIQSPSRVFAGLGGHISEAVGVGITQQKGKALTPLQNLARALPKIALNTARVGLPSAALTLQPALASASINTVQPINRSSGGVGAVVFSGDIHIHISGEHQDPQAIANEVQKQLMKMQHEARQKQNSALYD